MNEDIFLPKQRSIVPSDYSTEGADPVALIQQKVKDCSRPIQLKLEATSPLLWHELQV